MEAQLLDGAFEADGGDDVVQRPALGDVIVHVVGGDQAHVHLRRESVEMASRRASLPRNSMVPAR